MSTLTSSDVPGNSNDRVFTDSNGKQFKLGGTKVTVKVEIDDNPALCIRYTDASLRVDEGVVRDEDDKLQRSGHRRVTIEGKYDKVWEE